MITGEQVADLQPGDVVELREDRWPDVVVRGPLVARFGILRVRDLLVRDDNGRCSRFADSQHLTVVSRAPRPLYVNHPRTEPTTGDVVRYDGDDNDGDDVTWYFDGRTWRGLRHHTDGPIATSMPLGLTLLVDGETGQAVLS